ncbi:hypothetical protein C4D60_Mb05t28950 [Musa balbisiana]|uniref:Coenzyme Q-binding protein COQ10 START domain-containing protein n=1 Tax=Musa balbisiana TaxID=52838 RepID=A0A4S8JZP3_MUSBA|nr:hypothetical protein C4D60_Mb05t28950 [Musa balbisiana]
MSSAACISLGPTPLSHLKNAEKGAAFSLASVSGAGFRPSPNALFLRIPTRPSRRKPSPRRTAVRPFSPVMEWQDCRYSNEPSLAHFLPIPNQKIHWRSLEGLPNRRLLSYTSDPGKLHLHEFASIYVKLTVSYEIPEILIPVASALKPFLEGLLAQGLERFAKVAKEYQRKIPLR